MMLTCKSLYNRGPKFLLQHGASITTEDSLRKLAVFLRVDHYSRCHHLHDLSVSYLSADTSAFLLDIFSHSSRLRTLWLTAPELLFQTHTDLPATIASLRSLRSLHIIHAHEFTVELLRTLQSDLVSLSVNFLSEYGDGSTFWDTTDPSQWCDYHPVPLLQSVASTLVDLHCEVWHSNPGPRYGFTIPTYAQVYPRMRRLTIERCDYSVCLPFIRGFPGLSYLSVSTDHYDEFKHNGLTDAFREHREANIRSQRNSTTTWQHLEEFSGSLIDLYILGLTCHIARLSLIRPNDARHLELLHDIIQYAGPVEHLKLHWDSSILLSPEWRLVKLLGEDGASQLSSLSISVALEDAQADTDFLPALEELTAALERLPIRRLRIQVQHLFCFTPPPESLLRAGPQDSSPPPALCAAELSLEEWDIDAWVQRLAHVVPTLEDAVISVSRPRSGEDELPFRKATLARNDVRHDGEEIYREFRQ
ncbi:hypothetical protein BD310DRAFT_860315 [Dichomitus squalens]|uniref:F-box domain-containing protein n=1 Tax=Dichomitus squalens TaxID=114155 RepID=A0A4Q9PF44_9APHY|nr:hypothetical protein BD310DRAFT_860315 [Dichomitus squalens]